MSDDFDPKDFDAPRRDLSAYLLGLNGMVRDGERGYQAGLRSMAAAMLAAYKVLAKSYEAFSEMIEHECFEDDEKIQNLDKSNYRKHLAKCIVKRCFVGSDTFGSTRSKFTTVLKHAAAEGVEPAECAKTIKDAGGFKSFYEQAVEAKRMGKAASGNEKKGSTSKARALSGNKSVSNDTDDDNQDKAKPLAVKYILDNYLLVKMPRKKDLRRYLNGPFSEDERRGLEIAYDGEGPKGFTEWAFIAEIKVEKSNPPEEDNDNDPNVAEEVG